MPSMSTTATLTTSTHRKDVADLAPGDVIVRIQSKQEYRPDGSAGRRTMMPFADRVEVVSLTGTLARGGRTVHRIVVALSDAHGHLGTTSYEAPAGFVADVADTVVIDDDRMARLAARRAARQHAG